MRALKNLAVAGLVAVATAAHADPVITWTYEVTSVFDTTSTVFAPAIGPGLGSTTNSEDFLAWGVPAPGGSGEQSSLEILGNPAVGNIDTSFDLAFTPNEIGETQTFVHNNNVISTFSFFLDEVDVITTLTLTPFLPPGLELPPMQAVFNINFQETPNNLPCPAGAPNPCQDIFVLTGNFDAVSFDYDGETYFVQIFPFMGTPLVPLDPEQCAAAGASSPCIGFLTNENASNEVQFAFAITNFPITVPEPGSLALMALGLLGLGLTMRRRKSMRG